MMFTSVTLRYIGDSLKPDAITSSLGVSPTASGAAGDVVASTSGKGRILKMGFWEWSIKSDSEKNDQLNEQMIKFGDQFSNVYHKLDFQLNCEHSWIDIHVIERVGDFPASFPLSNSAVRILSETGLLIDFTINS